MGDHDAGKSDDTSFRKLLRVAPGAKVDLGSFDYQETFGRKKDSAEADLARVLDHLTDPRRASGRRRSTRSWS